MASWGPQTSLGCAPTESSLPTEATQVLDWDQVSPWLTLRDSGQAVLVFLGEACVPGEHRASPGIWKPLLSFLGPYTTTTYSHPTTTHSHPTSCSIQLLLGPS